MTMAKCAECGHQFKGLKLEDAVHQHMETGKWICRRCYFDLGIAERRHYVVI